MRATILSSLLFSSIGLAAQSEIIVDCSEPGGSDLVKKYDMCQTGYSTGKDWLAVGRGRVGPIGCKQVRFVGALLHSWWGGQPMCNDVLELLKSEGAVPYICMDPSVINIEKPKHTPEIFGPPKNLDDWRKLVRACARQTTQYGAVWYELWNEPNYSTFWSGSQEQLFDLYKILVEEVQKENPKAKFASAGITSAGISRWVGPFLDFVEKEKLPLDAVAFHDFGRDYTLAERWILPHVRQIQDELAKRPYFANKHIEIHVGECSFFGDPKDGSAADKTDAAARLPRMIRRLNEEKQLTLVQWAQLFDTGHDGHWGNLGVVDRERDKAKPLYNAFLMYAMMPERAVKTTETGAVKCLASKDDKTVAIWLYNETDAADTCRLTLNRLPFAPGERAYSYLFAIDSKRSSFWETDGDGRLEMIERKRIDLSTSIAGGASLTFDVEMPGPGLKLLLLSTERRRFSSRVILQTESTMPPLPVTGGVELNHFKSMESRLVPGKPFQTAMQTLRMRARSKTDAGREAQAVLDAIENWIDYELKRLEALKETSPAHALMALDDLAASIAGLPQSERAAGLRQPLSSLPYIKELVKIYREIDALEIELAENDSRTATERKRRLRERIESLLKMKDMPTILRDESENALDLLTD
ncbi:MAG: hypothetical protein ABIH86_00835 [Planctomycetota bacterium]